MNENFSEYTFDDIEIGLSKEFQVTITESLVNDFAKVFSIPLTDVSDESGPENIESWDSFNGLVLVDELENNFKIKFSISEITDVKTISDIKRHLKNHDVPINE